jgi:hypothetical protein
MNPDKSTDDDLRARFAILREDETREVPVFRTLLAAARGADPRRSAALPWCIAGATAAAVAAIVTIPMFLKSSAPATSVATLPVLLSAPSGSSPFFDAPLIAGSDLPTDALLPLHLQIPF